MFYDFCCFRSSFGSILRLNKWYTKQKSKWPQIANRLLINLGGSIYAIGRPLALLEFYFFLSTPVENPICCVLLFFSFLHFFGCIIAFFFWGHHMNTHHESGVKFMSPVTLAHLWFPRNPPGPNSTSCMYVCVCVCVCFCVYAFVCICSCVCVFAGEISAPNCDHPPILLWTDLRRWSLVHTYPHNEANYVQRIWWSGSHTHTKRFNEKEAPYNK